MKKNNFRLEYSKIIYLLSLYRNMYNMVKILLVIDNAISNRKLMVLLSLSVKVFI